MKKQHPAEIAAESNMEAAVRGASFFLASLFQGAGTYHKAPASTVAAALSEASKLEAASKSTHRCMIYAVSDEGRATLLTQAFIRRMKALAEQSKERTMLSKAEQVADLRVRRASARTTKPAATKAKAKASVPERTRYDWKAAEEKAANGKIPAKPDFSAATHKPFLGIFEEITTALKLEGPAAIKALKAVKINPTSSTPKAMDRYRNLCIKALSAA